MKCTFVVESEKDLCERHTQEEIHLVKHEEVFCSKCGEKEKWIWLKIFDFMNYEISSLGRVYSYKIGKYTKENPILTSNSYVGINLTNDNHVTCSRHINTWQGIAFFNLPFVNDGITTVDHIDRNRSNNRVCCNLRPFNKSEQAKNRKTRAIIKGKIVLKFSLDEVLVEEYISAIEASRDKDVTINYKSFVVLYMGI
uniref:HNH endonuclease n=1 Tax=Pithovirus LCPAC403 TaxID=2506596 RepID=A0A481ZAX1_9VIRU|nr:MAG: HNH endonuclease [Pithovirus LCPAC403]